MIDSTIERAQDESLAEAGDAQGQQADRSPEQGGAERAGGAGGAEQSSDRPNYYKELGLKEQRGTGEQQEQLRENEGADDKGDLGDDRRHQAEGPGGKGAFGGGGA